MRVHGAAGECARADRLPLRPVTDSSRMTGRESSENGPRVIALANLVAAVHQAAALGPPGTAWRLNAALWGFFCLRSHVNDWLGTSRTALTAARAAQDRTGEAWALTDVASAPTVKRSYAEAIALLQQAVLIRAPTRKAQRTSHCSMKTGSCPGEGRRRAALSSGWLTPWCATAGGNAGVLRRPRV